eukprot:scpid5380/ scgid27649/ Prolyl 4-hydroxylase subunit alpha
MLKTVMEAEKDVGWCGAVETNVTADVCKELLDKGFVVVDGIFGRGTSETFYKELEWLYKNGHMLPNQVQFQTSGGPVILEKPNIFEADMHDSKLTKLSEIGHFRQVFENGDKLVNIFNKLMPLGLKEGQKHRTVKLQYNSGGGGCFPWHYDNPSRPNNRGLTMLVYLNSDWVQGNGGELELLPFLERNVVIPPLMDRAVLFLSDRVLHRVLPCNSRRLCFTIWFDSATVNSDDDVFLKAKHLKPSAVDTLKSTPLQRILSRAVYREEYEQSLLDCFGHAEGGGVESRACKISLKLHSAHLQGLLKDDQMVEFVEYLRRLKPPASATGESAASS